jgi:F420-dependent oxidoreductase-like protein
VPLAAFLDPGKSLDEAVARVRLAESLGYHSAWVTHIAAREPLQLLNNYAHATERIGLGTAVVPIVLRHPALLAMETATLDEISGGRFTLGIGISHRITVEGWYGLSLEDPVGRMREYTTILRQILAQGSSSLEGRHYTSRFRFMGYEPRRDLKIFWAALGPNMLRAAAELADGVITWMCNPQHIRGAIRPVLDDALKSHGRSSSEFDVVAAIPSAFTDNADAARDVFRSRALPYLSLPFYRKEIERTHPDSLARFDERMAAGDMTAALAALDDSFVDAYAGIGDGQAIRAKVEEYRESGVTLPGIGPLPRHAGSKGVEATLEAAAG